MARVLVIDDDKQIRGLLRQVLERDGHGVEEAADGAQGVEVFAASPADLVIIDIFMPRCGGWETLRALQQLAPGLPFVIISAGAPLEVLKRGLPGTLASVRRLAEYRMLRKPFKLTALSDAVRELLAAKLRRGMSRSLLNGRERRLG